jgi:hypothetical protein
MSIRIGSVHNIYLCMKITAFDSHRFQILRIIILLTTRCLLVMLLQQLFTFFKVILSNYCYRNNYSKVTIEVGKLKKLIKPKELFQ